MAVSEAGPDADVGRAVAIVTPAVIVAPNCRVPQLRRNPFTPTMLAPRLCYSGAFGLGVLERPAPLTI
jgi:hypothetical protein